MKTYQKACFAILFSSLTLFGCGPQDGTNNNPTILQADELNKELITHQWELNKAVDTKNQPLEALDVLKTQVKLTFAKKNNENTIFFSLGCNSFQGNYKFISKSEITAQAAGTEKGCGSNLMIAEEHLSKMMNGNSKITIKKNNVIQLTQTGSSGTLIWTGTPKLQDNITSITFGESNLMCQPSMSCETTYKLTESALFDQTPCLYPCSTERFENRLLSGNQYDIAKKINGLIPEELITSKKTTFGCPGCLDQPTLNLKIETEDGKNKAWSMDSDIEKNPAFLQTLAKEINQATTSLNFLPEKDIKHVEFGYVEGNCLNGCENTAYIIEPNGVSKKTYNSKQPNVHTITKLALTTEQLNNANQILTEIPLAVMRYTEQTYQNGVACQDCADFVIRIATDRATYKVRLPTGEGRKVARSMERLEKKLLVISEKLS